MKVHYQFVTVGLSNSFRQIKERWHSRNSSGAIAIGVLVTVLSCQAKHASDTFFLRRAATRRILNATKFKLDISRV